MQSPLAPFFFLVSSGTPCFGPPSRILSFGISFSILPTHQIIATADRPPSIRRRLWRRRSWTCCHGRGPPSPTSVAWSSFFIRPATSNVLHFPPADASFRCSISNGVSRFPIAEVPKCGNLALCPLSTLLRSLSHPLCILVVLLAKLGRPL